MEDKADADVSGVGDGVGDGVGVCVASVGDGVGDGPRVSAAGVSDGVGDGVAVVASEIGGSSSKHGRAGDKGSLLLLTPSEPIQP